MVDTKIGDYVNWDQNKIDAWNKDHGLDHDTVEMMLNQSMWPTNNAYDGEPAKYGEA